VARGLRVLGERISAGGPDPAEWLSDQFRRPEPVRTLRELQAELDSLTGLETVKERLRSDLDAFRTDVEGDHEDIEEWDYLDGRIFATVGSFEDEFDPNSSHGWMCRLIDSGALGIAGFERVRKPELDLEGSP